MYNYLSKITDNFEFQRLNCQFNIFTDKIEQYNYYQLRNKCLRIYQDSTVQQQ